MEKQFFLKNLIKLVDIGIMLTFDIKIKKTN